MSTFEDTFILNNSKRGGRAKAKFGAAVILSAMLSAGSASAGLLGGGSGGGLGVSVDVGVADADVSIGGSDGGVSASANVGGQNGVDADVQVGGGGGNVASVNASVGGSGGLNTGISIGGGTLVGPDGTPITGGPGVVPRTPSGLPVTQVSALRGRGACAGGGNSNALNGVPVNGRDGQVLGWVHSTVLNSSNEIDSLRIQANSSAVGSAGCFTLTGDFRSSSNGLMSQYTVRSFQ